MQGLKGLFASRKGVALIAGSLAAVGVHYLGMPVEVATHLSTCLTVLVSALIGVVGAIDLVEAKKKGGKK